MPRRIPRFAAPQFDHLAFDGGLDLETPTLYAEKSYCRDAQNFELMPVGGYRRVPGYERFDGQAAPSGAAYAILPADITGTFSVGDTLTGATSGATAVIADVSAALDYFVITQVVGTFQAGESLYVGSLADSGTAQDGTATSLTLAATASAVDDFYNGMTLRLPDDGRERVIADYDGATQIATIGERWPTNLIAPSLPPDGDWFEGVGLSLSFVASAIEGQQAVKLTNLGTHASNDQAVRFGLGTGFTDIAVQVLIENVDAEVTGVLIFTSTGPTIRCKLTWATLDLEATVGAPNIQLQDRGVGPNGGRLVLIQMSGADLLSAVDSYTLFLYHAGILQNAHSTILHIVQIEALPIPGSLIFATASPILLPDSSTDYEVFDPVAICNGAQVVDGAATAQLHARYRNAAADIFRADIAAVPGSGRVLGVVPLDNVVYAFRNNAGGAAADLYQSSAAGWVQVPLGRELAFTAGNTEVFEGETIVGATSGATAVVTRVVLESGSWDAGTAAGRFIFAAQTGTFVAENLDVQGGAANVATISGDSAAITLNPDGRYEFVLHTLQGGAGNRRIYGASGTHRGFEFDGTVFVPIQTGMDPDTPRHVFVHKKHLFFAFGPSVQHSGTGFPYQWTVITGAGEINQGDDVTGFVEQPGSEATGGALVILSRNRISVLYGSSSADWNQVTYAREQGAYEHTIQKLGPNVLMLDDRGLTSLARTIAFGNFHDSILAQRIRTLLKTRRLNATATCVSRDQGQYRLFFADGFALYATFNGNKFRGVMPMRMPVAVQCIFSAETNTGAETIYFGDSDGFVYQLDKGTSFDGDTIEAYIMLAWNFSKSPRQKKHYTGCMLEAKGGGYAEFAFTFELGYADSARYEQPGNQDFTFDFSPARWDSAVWGSFHWDGRSLLPEVLDMGGSAENVSLIIRSNSDQFEPATFSGALVTFFPRRRLR